MIRILFYDNLYCSYMKHEARKEWAESKEKERKDFKLRGIDDSN